MKTIPIMDKNTYDRVTRSLVMARWYGLSPADQLNRDGLVWTQAREREVVLRTMRYILDEMSDWSPAAFLRRRNKALESCTPTDMYICIREWLQEHIAHARTES